MTTDIKSQHAVRLRAVLTSVSTVQEHQRSSAALQESAQTLQGLCCSQVDLIQQDPVALLHCQSQGSLQRNAPRIYKNTVRTLREHFCTGTVSSTQPLSDSPPLDNIVPHLHKREDHGCLTGSDLLLSLTQLNRQRLPTFLQQGSCTSTPETLVFHCTTEPPQHWFLCLVRYHLTSPAAPS